MLLVIDIGNTNTSLGVFEKDELVHTFALSSDIKKTDDEYGINLLAILNHKNITSKIKGAIVSSVVPQLCEIYKNAIKKYLDIVAITLSYKSNMPIIIGLILILIFLIALKIFFNRRNKMLNKKNYRLKPKKKKSF